MMVDVDMVRMVGIVGIVGIDCRPPANNIPESCAHSRAPMPFHGALITLALLSPLSIYAAIYVEIYVEIFFLPCILAVQLLRFVARFGCALHVTGLASVGSAGCTAKIVKEFLATAGLWQCQLSASYFPSLESASLLLESRLLESR